MAGLVNYAYRLGPMGSLIGYCWTLLLLASAESNATEPWYHHTSNLNTSSGGVCTAGPDPDLSLHFSEALLDIMLFQATDDKSSAKLDTCSQVPNIINLIRSRTNQTFVFLSPSLFEELDAATTYFRLLGQSADIVASRPAVAGQLPAFADYMSQTGRIVRGSLRTDLPGQLTAAPAISELANATYSFLLDSNWSYVGFLWESEPGSARLSQQLQLLWRTDRRICFPLLLSFNSNNATDAARALKDFVYTSRRLPRFTVVFAGSGTTFLRLWDLVSGGDSAFADSEKRYQLVLVGAAFSSFHRMSDTTRRRNLGLGTVFIFPGVLDPDPSTDELGTLFASLTADAASMGRFSELRATHGRLNWLKQSTSSQCVWSDFNSLCYLLALRYDFQALSLAPLLADGVPSLGSLADVQSLRQKTVTLASLRTKFTMLNSFVRAGFTTYSMDRGLQHTTRGFWQPIVKIYQSQLRGTSYSLEKLGELAVKQAGTAAQSYEFNATGVSLNLFYQLTSGNPDIFPTQTSSFASECPASCPECVSDLDKQFVQFKEGDIYLGALVPVFYRGADLFDCSDGSFRKKSVGGYEFAKAFKFVVEMVDALSQGTPMPQGFSTSQVDQQFLLGVRDLLQRVHDRRTKRLRWGYVVLDTCYSPSCTVRRLGSLLDGSLALAPGFNFTKVVGFVGAHSSTQTMASSQLLKMYNLPLISYGSTSTALSDVNQYPFVLRTVSSDTAIIEGMVRMLKYLKVDYFSVVYASSAYGMSLKEEMVRISSREGLCISKLIVFDCGGADESCKRSLMLDLKSLRAQYVAFLSNLPDLISLLNYPQAETDISYLTLLTTESVGVSDAAFVDKKNIGLGTLSLQLASSPTPAFSAFVNYSLTRMPPNPNNISQWDRLFFEDAQQCYLPGSFERNMAFTQACRQSLVQAHPITEVESRAPFVIDATSTLVLGSLTAMTYLCQVTTPEPACPGYFPGDFQGMLQRANLVMYGSVGSNDPRPQTFSGNYAGSAWSYRKVFDNRMGQTPFSMWQYRKLGSGDYRFVQIGLFDGASSLSFTESPAQLESAERSGSGSTGGSSSCRTRAQCGVTDASRCANPSAGSRAASTDGDSGGDNGSYLGFLALLIIPGFLLGFLPICVYNLCRNRLLETDEEAPEESINTGVANQSFRSMDNGHGGDVGRTASDGYDRMSGISGQQHQQHQQQQVLWHANGNGLAGNVG